MTRNYKIVIGNNRNKDERLCSFYESMEEALDNVKATYENNKSFVGDIRRIRVKPVRIDEITNPVPTDYSHYVRSLIPDSEWKRVMKSDASCEIDANCLMCGGGGVTYYNLSRMIPKHWTVIDFGAGYGAQSYLFTEHHRYIAVEPSIISRVTDFSFEYFKAEGTERYDVTAGDFIRKELPMLDPKTTFAICNYVPDWYNESASELVRHNFRNVFTFYPHTE